MGWREGQDGARGVGEAVAAHPAAAGPGDGAPAAGSDQQQVARAAGGIGQDWAGLAAPDQGLDRQAGGRCSPGQVQRVLELLVGVLGPEVAEFLVGGAPVGQVTTRWQPGEDGHQGGVVVAG